MSSRCGWIVALILPALSGVTGVTLPAAGPDAAAPAPLVAITIDDLPWAGAAFPGRLEATDRLLAALREHGAPATGFVISDRIDEDEPILERWLAAGMDLGSHSAAHRDLNDADLKQWLDDVTRCDEALRKKLNRPVRFFRYPYLHQGPTPERRDAAAALIGRLGYTVAHVTIDNIDWRIARWYAEAIEKKDAARRGDLARVYVDHVMAATRHFQEVARKKVGRDVAHILLLHANQVAADHVGDLLGALRKEGFRFIKLHEALEDPVYRLPDDYLGRWGCSWLDRIAPADRKQEWIDEQDSMLRARFESPSGGR